MWHLEKSCYPQDSHEPSSWYVTLYWLCLLNRICPPVVSLYPARLDFSIPAFTKSCTNPKIRPSHPLAAMMSTVTGKTSSWRVMLEKYAAEPTGADCVSSGLGSQRSKIKWHYILGTTKSGPPQNGLTLLMSNPAGTSGGPLYWLR